MMKPDAARKNSANGTIVPRHLRPIISALSKANLAGPYWRLRPRRFINHFRAARFAHSQQSAPNAKGRPKNSMYNCQCSDNTAGRVDGLRSGRSSGNNMIGGVSQSDTAALFQSVTVVGGAINQRHSLLPMCSKPAISRAYFPAPTRHTITAPEFVRARVQVSLADTVRRRPISSI